MSKINFAMFMAGLTIGSAATCFALKSDMSKLPRRKSIR